MPISPRRSQVRIAYSSAFASQSDFGDPLSNSAIDAVFSLTDNEPRFEITTKDDEIIDCSGQYKIDEVVLAKSCTLSFGIYAEASVLAGLLGWAFGTISGDDILMLGPTEFQPPATTLIYGHDGGNVDPLKLQDMVIDSISISGRVNERIKCNVTFKGHGEPPAATGYSFPECADVDPIYLKDGAFTLNSEDRAADLREFDFTYGNKLLSDEDPYTSTSVNITRMERADRRDYLLKFKLFGEPNDTTHQAALAKTKMPWTLQIGADDDGIEISCVSGILKQDGAPSHDGEARRSVLNLINEPIRISGNNDTPVKATVLS